MSSRSADVVITMQEWREAQWNALGWVPSWAADIVWQ
jgi:hypothetical protein